MTTLSRFLLPLILTACCAQAYASGSSLPLASFRYSYGGQYLASTSPGSYTGTSCGGPGNSCETDTASATANLVLQTSGTGGAGWSAEPTVTVGVYYELVGPPNTQAQVTITGFGSVNVSTRGDAFSTIDAGTGNPAKVCTEIFNPNFCSNSAGSNSGPLVQTLTVNSNTVYEFVMQTGCTGLDGTCSSYLDPSVVVTSSNASSFVVELSPNVTTVPEPSTIAMVVTGLGLARRTIRRKGTKRSS